MQYVFSVKSTKDVESMTVAINNAMGCVEQTMVHVDRSDNDY